MRWTSPRKKRKKRKQNNSIGVIHVLTSTQFVNKLKDIAINHNTLYVMGCFGAPMTSANKKRYTSNHSYNRGTTRTAKISGASSNTFGFDCACLIKSVLWGWSGNTQHTYGGAKYASNNAPDINADQMISRCQGVSANFSNIEVGEAVWMPGHIGVYIGNNQVVECTPIWLDGVQITTLGNRSKSGRYRVWNKHGKLPWVDYSAAKWIPSVGDIVDYRGTAHYSSANSNTAYSCKGGQARISAIHQLGKSKHPYHLIRIAGSGATVYGWVDAGSFKKSK